MQIKTSRTFTNKAKKLDSLVKLELDKQVILIFNNPNIGEQKKGDLSRYRIHKFKFNQLQWLLAYYLEGDTLYLVKLDSHENFYNQLKKQVN